MKAFKASWSTSLIVVSCLASVLCLGISIGLFVSRHGEPIWAALLPLAIVLGAAPFTVRGYAISNKSILINRLFWNTRLPLKELKSAEYKPDAMRSSIRTFGNGGLFSFSGFFYNKALGSYRAFVTDPHSTVVVQFARRTIVLSPASPEDFVRELLAAYAN
jgi:hypothetical protein